MSLISRFLPAERSGNPLSLGEWSQYFDFGNVSYPYGLNSTLVNARTEDIPADFLGYVDFIYKNNGVVFALTEARRRLFSEARFQFRQLRSGRPGDLFGSQALASLEAPWPGGTTGDLLSRMIQDVDLAGNAFVYRDGDQLKRLRPDWVTIVLGSMSDPEIVAGDLNAEVLGYLYHQGGRNSGHPVLYLQKELVAHFAPIPDPTASWRGMSWITPILTEIQADSAATVHKQTFFENGATVNLVVSLDASITTEKFNDWVAAFNANHQGAANAYKTLFMGGGADIKALGSNFQQIEFKATQGAGETRIAAAAGVPPIIVGLSEGLQAATYSNYGQARRAFSDGTMRPLWRNVCGSLAKIIQIPSGSELWYDDRDISFLQEDQKDASIVQQGNAAAINTLVSAGFTPDSARDAVVAGDLKLLQHSGLVSVQLNPPGQGNGNGNGASAPASISPIPPAPAP